MSQVSGQAPTYLFPIIPTADDSVTTITLQEQLWIPLYNGPASAKPVIDYALSAAAGPPRASHGDRTYTITLKRGLRWSNGTPVTSRDVAFDIALLRAAVKSSAANWGSYIPGQFPASVKSVRTPNARTIVINLKRAYNPTYFLYDQLQDVNSGVYPLPASSWNIAKRGGPHIKNWATSPAAALAIYNYLNKQGATLSTWSTNPLWKVIDGPYRLTSFNTTNSSYTLKPNPHYDLSPKARAIIQTNTYTSEAAILTALETGSLDIGSLAVSSQVRSFPALESRGISVFGSPSWAWNGGQINYTDHAASFNKLIAQPYMRAALAELINQPAMVKGIYHGWAVPDYGPVAVAPFSPYVPSHVTRTPYPYNPSKAVATLKAHGWKVVPNGSTTCLKPGRGAGHCGAGIAKGNPIALVWATQPESADAGGYLSALTFSSAAKHFAGISVQIQTKTFNILIGDRYNVETGAGKKYANNWAVVNFGGITNDLFPTQNNLASPGGGYNSGGYNDPGATRLLNATVFGSNPHMLARQVAYLTRSYPAFYLPDFDAAYGVSKRVGGSADAFLALSNGIWADNLFYVKKR